MSRDSLRSVPAQIGGTSTLRPRTQDGEHNTRENLAERSKKVETRFPRALNLEAAILDAMRPALGRARARLAGTHDSDYFGEMTLGNKQSMPLYDICRLAQSGLPEAGAAVDALLTVLARERGLVLSQAETTTVEAHEALAAFAGAAGSLVENMTRDLRDNHLDAAEAAERLPQVRRLKACVSVLETLIETAQRMPERTGR